jgi:hypothetical protein
MKWAERISTVQCSSILAPDESEMDHIPTTLVPVMQSILNDFVPMIQATLISTQKVLAIPEFAAGKALPRLISNGDIVFPLGPDYFAFRRGATPFTLWKAQEVLGVYKEMCETDKKTVERWLTSLHPERGPELLKLDIPRLERRALRVKLQK